MGKFTAAAHVGAGRNQPELCGTPLFSVSSQNTFSHWGTRLRTLPWVCSLDLLELDPIGCSCLTDAAAPPAGNRSHICLPLPGGLFPALIRFGSAPRWTTALPQTETLEVPTDSGVGPYVTALRFDTVT